MGTYTRRLTLGRESNMSVPGLYAELTADTEVGSQRILQESIGKTAPT